MGIARYLSKLASVLSTDGVVPAAKGGTGLASPGASGNLLVSNGTSWTSAAGLAGPTGPAGLGFTIAKTYSSVAALTADTSPTGITAGQFALIDTGDINNAENSRLYVWNGTNYTYTSDLSGAQGIVGPTGPAGTNGIIGVDGAQGPTGPTGPAGTAPTGGATYYTGDIVISANSAQYTAPTWLPCNGAMYDPGTYPGLDALYQTAGDYANTPGLFTEPRDTAGAAVTWGQVNSAMVTNVLDPITGDLLSYNFAMPAGSRLRLIQRASDGRFVYDPNNQLAAQVVGDWSSYNTNPFFAISPNGQLLFVYKYSGGYMATVYKRNTQAVENSTGNRWQRMVMSTTAITLNTSYWNMTINNNGVIVFPYNSNSYAAFAKYDINGNTLSSSYIPSNIQMSVNSIGYTPVVWHPTLQNYAAVASGTTSSYYSGIYVWDGSAFTPVSYATTTNTYHNCAINRAGTGAYFSRSSAIDVYSIDSGTGNMTFSHTMVMPAGVNLSITFSQGDAFMAVANGTAGLIMYQRTAPGALTYNSTGYSPENYSNFGMPIAGWRLEFEPVYNTLVGFGTNNSTFSYTVQNWKGIAKTIVPATPNPGNKLKYYIKTGS